jgi:microcystin-dependent protein
MCNCKCKSWKYTNDCDITTIKDVGVGWSKNLFPKDNFKFKVNGDAKFNNIEVDDILANNINITGNYQYNGQNIKIEFEQEGWYFTNNNNKFRYALFDTSVFPPPLPTFITVQIPPGNYKTIDDLVNILNSVSPSFMEWSSENVLYSTNKRLRLRYINTNFLISMIVRFGTDIYGTQSCGMALGFNQLVDYGISPYNSIEGIAINGINTHKGCDIGIVNYFTNRCVPTNYLIADGRYVPIADYFDLFTVVADIYGTIDFSTNTFKLPNLTGEFIRGWTNNPSSPDTGRGFGSNQLDAMQRITGRIGDFNSFAGISGPSNTTSPFTRVNIGSSVYNRAIASGGANDNYARIEYDNDLSARTSNETRPVNISLLPCIKFMV